jgi:site-specific recombinase XerD
MSCSFLTTTPGQILNPYNTTDDSKPVFPLSENRDVIWNDINQIGIMAGLKEGLSYHTARHSFATLLLSAGISIASITKMMGHANISTMQGHAKVTDDKILASEYMGEEKVLGLPKRITSEDFDFFSQ